MAILNFLKYNNAVPIVLSVVVLGGGAAFAATDPAAVYSSTQQIVSIDNTYLVNKNLSTYTPKIQITGVTEDADYYYVAYTLSTIDLKDSTWQDVSRDETMQVSKADLGQYRDLGVYATEKMKDIVDREAQRLTDTQSDARKHVSQKVVATEYGGLIGKFLDRTTEELPGYTPVVQAAPQAAAAADVIPLNLPGGDSGAAQPSAPASAPTNAAPGTSESPPRVVAVTSPAGPTLQVLGPNPAQIPLRAVYSDFGAVISSPQKNLGIHVFVNGAEVSDVSIDTSVVGDTVITYKVTDQDGNTGSATRTVHVFNPNPAVVTPAAPESTTATTTAP